MTSHRGLSDDFDEKLNIKNIIHCKYKIIFLENFFHAVFSTGTMSFAGLRGENGRGHVPENAKCSADSADLFLNYENSVK